MDTYMRFIPVLLLAAAVCSSCSPSAEDLQKDPHGDLIWAARHGDVATVRNLAARGVDLDCLVNRRPEVCVSRL